MPFRFGEEKTQLSSASTSLSGTPNTILHFAASPRLPKRYIRMIIGIFIISGSLYLSQLQWKFLQATSTEGYTVPYPDAQDASPFNESAPINSTIPPLPPLYERYREYEDDLSVNNLLNHAGGIAEGSYIFFANHASGCGWGNVLQEMVFSAMLAGEAKLGYVWDDYTWDSSGNNYSDYNGRVITSRIPLSTMIRGHILGIDESSSNTRANHSITMPPSISSRVFERLCPRIERVVIDKETVESYLHTTNSNIRLPEATGKQVLDAWLAVLETPKYKNARCIEVNKFSPDHAFDIWLLGSPRMHSLWPTLSNSPVLKLWSWSPLIKRAFLKNIRNFAAEGDLQISLAEYLKGWWTYLNPAPAIIRTAPFNASIQQDPKVRIKHRAKKYLLNDTHTLPVLALHLRRGDFAEHCIHLAEWGSTYTGFNSFPESRARDAFDVPDVVEGLEEAANGTSASDPLQVASMERRKEVYARHCLPDIQQIVKRVREVVMDYAALVHEKERLETEVVIRAHKNWRWWIPDVIVEKLQHIRNSTTTNSVKIGAFGLLETSQTRVATAANKYFKKIYILTNGESGWLDEVKHALQQDTKEWDGIPWEWEDIATSRDLRLGWEEKPVSQALDMYVAQRAEVFIGNGVSLFRRFYAIRGDGD
uniref:Uncharacterized protein n=1 Tax=Psilocybe cubensis TaxID=181762 RepID=A0A8H7XVM8_PSICU